MDIIPFALSNAALAAGARVGRTAAEVAGQAVHPANFARTQAGMAQAARAAVFADALLAEIHARLAELKAVSK